MIDLLLEEAERSVVLGGREPDGGPARQGRGDPLGGAGCRAVLVAVGAIDRVLGVAVWVQEADVALDAARRNPADSAALRRAVPGRRRAVDRPDVDVVVVTDGPDRHRRTQRPVRASRRDL